MEAYKDKEGNIKFSNTGDTLIDRWEEQIANGQMPDLTEAFTKESWEATKARLSRARSAKIMAGKTSV
jgi:hypothetical protein